MRATVTALCYVVYYQERLKMDLPTYWYSEVLEG